MGAYREVTYTEEVYISEFDDAEVIREACRRIEKRATKGALDTETERQIETMARLLGLPPGSLPPPSSAAYATSPGYWRAKPLQAETSEAAMRPAMPRDEKPPPAAGSEG
jgi:hypothetical protein